MIRDQILSLTEVFSLYVYHPPTKLRENNVFSDVCLSFCLQGGRRGVPLQGSNPHPLPPYTALACSPDMFKLVHLGFHCWKAGGCHSTEMPSCFFLRSISLNFNKWYMYIFKLTNFALQMYWPNQISHCLCKFETGAIGVFTISKKLAILTLLPHLYSHIFAVSFFSFHFYQLMLVNRNRYQRVSEDYIVRLKTSFV